MAFFYYNHLLTIEINTILRKYIYNIYNIWYNLIVQFD